MKIDYLKIVNNFVKNTGVAGVETENVKEQPKALPENKNAMQTGNTVDKNSSLTLSKEVKFNLINRMEQAKLLKEILGVPQEIEELLSFLTYKKVSAETLEALLKQNQKINTDIIRQMLQENSRESLDKLLKLFRQAPGGIQNTEQIKDIMALLSQIVTKKELSANDTLTNLTLLYLPWIPLAEKQHVEVRFEKKESQDSDESAQTVLVIYITTINLGRFKISILQNKDSSINIDIENTGEAKKEFLENILNEINTQAKKDKINLKTELLVLQAKQENHEERKREIIISPARDVSPVLIITAQKIAKIILETDEKISLIEKRQEMSLEES